ncbi:MAG: DciA family protein [Planctomycetota bacterium]|jgi:predicted nucleic acid-binding Zn ribbon protein
MDDNERLCRVVRWGRKPKPVRAVHLGDVLGEVMNKRISPQQARFGPVAEAWGHLLPEELSQHCRISDISGGQLKVLVDSPSYAHELRMCCPELLEELRQECPRAKIKKIRVVIS